MERAVENHDELAPFLAHHYVEAVRPEDADLAWAGEEEKLAELREKAVAWLRRAAELVVGRYEIDEGLGLLHRAVELGSREWKQTDAWREIGRANALKYDGEAFWAAMQNAISASVDRQTQAELYGELVFQTAIRSGMWRLRPGRELVESWISRGLDLATPDSRARAKALIARSHWQPVAAEEAAREARSIAELLGDAELRSYALDSLAVTAFAGNRFEECLGWSERRLELLDEISDPGHHASILAGAALGYLGCGRIHDARRLARTHEELTRQLTPHHQLHGVAYLLEVEELAGNWQGIRRLGPNVEEAVAANLTTPCVLTLARSSYPPSRAHTLPTKTRLAASKAARRRSVWRDTASCSTRRASSSLSSVASWTAPHGCSGPPSSRRRRRGGSSLPWRRGSMRLRCSATVIGSSLTPCL
jgi:hypothetical protein